MIEEAIRKYNFIHPEILFIRHNEIYESKLDVHAPYWSYITEHCLRTGLVSHGEILDRAMELCKEETGDCIWPDVPERYWSQAVGEMLSAQKCHINSF